jgi:HAD superfamily hydrolase (TIGR01509 family)
MVKAIVFDLYETLVTQSGADVPRAGTLGGALGLDATAYRKQWKLLRPRVLWGELTFRDALMESGARLGVDVSASHVQQACDDRARANSALFHKIDPGLLTLTRDLHARGIRLGTISNCIAEDVAAWPECALAPYFDCAVFSFVAGVTKPDLRIYLEAMRQLGAEPSDALYIGDGGDDELAGAQRAGLRVAQAMWFVSRDPSPGIPLLVNPADAMRLVLQ